MGAPPAAQVGRHRQQHPEERPVLEHLTGARPRPVSRHADAVMVSWPRVRVTSVISRRISRAAAWPVSGGQAERSRLIYAAYAWVLRAAAGQLDTAGHTSSDGHPWGGDRVAKLANYHQ